MPKRLPMLGLVFVPTRNECNLICFEQKDIWLAIALANKLSSIVSVAQGVNGMWKVLDWWPKQERWLGWAKIMIGKSSFNVAPSNLISYLTVSGCAGWAVTELAKVISSLRMSILWLRCALGLLTINKEQDCRRARITRQRLCANQTKLWLRAIHLEA